MYICICNRLNDKTVAAAVHGVCAHKTHARTSPLPTSTLPHSTLPCAEDVYAHLGAEPQCRQCACVIEDMIDNVIYAPAMAAE